MDSPPPPSRAIEPISSLFRDGSSKRVWFVQVISFDKVTRLVIESSNRVSAIKRDEEGGGGKERKEERKKEKVSLKIIYTEERIGGRNSYLRIINIL